MDEVLFQSCYKNSIDVIKTVAANVAREVAPGMVGTGCTFDVQFSVRADGNGAVMLHKILTTANSESLLNGYPSAEVVLKSRNGK